MSQPRLYFTLEFTDWELLGAFFDTTAWVLDSEALYEDEPSGRTKMVFKKLVGFKARAVALRNGQQISQAEAECMFAEDNWRDKPRFQLRSMAQTRACAKVLRNCLAWIVKLPESALAEDAEEPEPKAKSATKPERLAIIAAAQDMGVDGQVVLDHIKATYNKDGTATLSQDEARGVLAAVRAGKLTSSKDLW